MYRALNDDEDQEEDQEPDESQISANIRKDRKPWPLIFFGIGLFLLVCGFILPDRFDKAVDDSVWEQMRMDARESKSFKNFVGQVEHPEEEDDVLLKFYVFDVQNPRLALSRMEKFRVKEIGPFVYKLNIKHVNVSLFNEGNEREFDNIEINEIYYKAWQTAHLLVGGERGGRDDQQLFTSISMPFQIVMKVTESLPFPLKRILRHYFLGPKKQWRHKYFVKKSVRDYLFGYEEDFSSPFPKKFEGETNNTTNWRNFLKDEYELIQLLNKKISMYHHRLGKFELFSNSKNNEKKLSLPFPGFVQNFSSPQEVDKKLGFDALHVDREKPHTYHWYQGSSQMRKCPKETCPLLWGNRESNRVFGSDGKFWGGKQDAIQFVFLPELLRTARVVADGDDDEDNNDDDEGLEKRKRQSTRHVHGIQCKRFRLDQRVFMNATSYLPNEGFFAFNQPNGVFNLSPLLADLPVFASKPRFLHGDSLLFNNIHGMDPGNDEEHDITFDVHFETGISVLVSERFQYNYRVFDDVFLPIFWLETIETLSSKHAGLFQKCDRYQLGAEIISISFQIIGILLIALSISIGTFRSEMDAKRHQFRALREESLEHQERDEIQMERIHTIRDVFHVFIRSQSIRQGWLSTPPFVFFMNGVIEILSLKKAKHAGLFYPLDDEPITRSLFVQLIITAFILGTFVTMNGVAVARAAYIRGEVPRRKLPHPWVEHRRGFMLPWLFTDDACKMGMMVGTYFILIWSFPMGLVFFFYCGLKFSGGCQIFWAYAVLIKGAFAFLESIFVFPLAVWRTLHVDMEQQESF